MFKDSIFNFLICKEPVADNLHTKALFKVHENCVLNSQF